jgi:hypothetical protein
MRSRITVGVIVLVGLIGAATLAARANSNVGVDKQWTVTNFPNPVLVKDTLIMGPVLIVHDSAKMARGEACTTFYRFKPGGGQQEELVSFHCRPRQAAAVDETTFTVLSTDTACKRLVEYQIGGDTEVHAVPVK